MIRDFILWLAKFITKIVIFLILISVIAVGFTKFKTPKSVGKNSGHRVAVVELTGPIMTAKEIIEELHNMANDDDIDGIVFSINSPGGAVAPSQEIYETIKKIKDVKPVVAAMGTVAASGGLYSALSASKIFVLPGTQTGSIGVIAQIPNFYKAANNLGVDFLTVTSGELKDIGNPTRPLAEKDKKFLQETVNKIYQQFFNAVVEGRNLNPEDVKKYADGRLILGSEAVELGLADSFGDVYAASRAIYEILEEPLGEREYPELVYQDDEFSEIKKLFKTASSWAGQIISNNLSYYQKPGYYFY